MHNKKKYFMIWFFENSTFICNFRDYNTHTNKFKILNWGKSFDLDLPENRETHDNNLFDSIL